MLWLCSCGRKATSNPRSRYRRNSDARSEMAAQITYASARASLRVRASASEQSARLIRPNAVTRPALRAAPPSRVGGFSGNVMAAAAEPEQIEKFLDGLKYDDKGLVVAIAQDVDTGSILMQGFADRTAVRSTITKRQATFFSRSRQAQWTKGETSGNFISVKSIHLDCDEDSIIYLGVPDGPTCHTGAHTCYFSQVDGDDGAAAVEGGGKHGQEEALTTLYELEETIRKRKTEAVKEGDKPSWTRKLLDNPELLCKKIREEAGELCETLENDEGKERAASEMADVLYHSMVLLNLQGVGMEDVLAKLRGRFGTSGVEEKANRPPKSKQAHRTG